MGLGVLLQDAGSDLLKTGGFAPNFSALLRKKINIMVFLNVQKGNFEFSAPNCSQDLGPWCWFKARLQVKADTASTVAGRDGG